MKHEHVSAHHEPALSGTHFETDPAEDRAENPMPEREEIDRLRDSIANEPWQQGAVDGPTFGEWLVRKRDEVSRAGSLWFTLLAALIGGPFAILGAFLAGQQGAVQIVYIVIMGPITEELLKQSGMIYMLERKPYRVFSAGQIVFAGALSALIFATVENLMYIHVYTYFTHLEHPAQFAQFRWTVCTALHVGCSIIASLGLIRVWRRTTERGEPADLAYAFPLFATAMVLHGVYNVTALFFDDLF